MSMSKLPLLSALSEKMRWHQTRQGVLAENVANAETPGFKGRDLAKFDFAEHMRGTGKPLRASTTSVGHIRTNAETESSFGAQKAAGYDVTPDRNAVNLEGQMMKVTSNQLDYQAATSLYSRSIKILKVAMGR